MLFLEEQPELSILSSRVILSSFYHHSIIRSGCSRSFFQGFFRIDNFWQQLLIKTLINTTTYQLLSYKTLMKVFLFNQSSCSHPSLEVVVYLFLSLKWWQSSILWSLLCRFHSLYHCSHSLSLITIFCHYLSLVVTLCHYLSLVVPLVVTLCHSLSFVVTRCHSLSLVVIRCHSLSFVVTCCHSLSLFVIRCHSLSLVVPLVVTRSHLLSLVVSLVVTHYHSMYHSSVFL